MKYRVLPEYLYTWTNYADMLIVDDEEIAELAREWDKSVEELMNEVEPVSMKRFVVNLTVDGATSAIDTVVAIDTYTADDYIAECDENANGEWCAMVHSGEITLEEGDQMTIVNVQDSAVALLDGGWAPEDRDQLQTEYELTDDEVDAIITEMRKRI